MKNLMLSIFVFCAVLATAHSLKCYVCAGTEDDCSKKKLEANKDNKTQDCPSGMNECMRVWGKKDGKTAVATSCTNSLGCDVAKKACDDVKDGECVVGCCDSDYCNAGSSEGLSTAHSLKCYVCQGTEDDCSKKKLEANKDSKSRDCPSGMNKCMRVWGKKDGKTGVANSCTNSLGCDVAKKVCDDVKDGKCAVGCCDSDYCNAGSSVSVSVILMTVSSALGLALLK